jgi:hypothetical protein
MEEKITERKKEREIERETEREIRDGERNRRTMIEREASLLLDLTDHKLETFSALNYHLYPKTKLHLLRVLILRRNHISDLTIMSLRELHCLTDLDLGNNALKGAVPRRVFPDSLQRLDLSGNDLDDLSGLISCVNLLSLNVGNNCLKVISGLPPKLEALDFSYNMLSSVIPLRLLSLSPSIILLRMVGNPVVEIASFSLCRVTVCSVLPNLQQLDDDYIPGRHVRSKSAVHTRKGQNGTLSTRTELGSKDSTIYFDRRRDYKDDMEIKSVKVSRKGQEEGDLIRSGVYAKRLEAVEKERTIKKQDIIDLANPSVINQQAEKRLIHRLSCQSSLRG